MGVTAHFYALDPGAYARPPTIDDLVERGDLVDLAVAGTAAGRLKMLDTRLGDNQRWYDNLAGAWAWEVARQHVEEVPRAAIDHWLSHLFWTGDDAGACGRGPVRVAEFEVFYDRALLEHIASLACPLDPIEAALAYAFGGDPPRAPRLHRPWIYDADCFCDLVFTWQRVVAHALDAGPDWGMLRWVWV